MARLLLTSLRDKVDVACRLGGGRFALLLPNTPPGPDAAGLVAERVRQRVAATRLSDDELGELGRFTMSLGVAGFPEAAEDADELAGVAGRAARTARAAGGDRIEPPLPEPEEGDGEGETRRRTSRPDGRSLARRVRTAGRPAGRPGPPFSSVGSPVWATGARRQPDASVVSASSMDGSPPRTWEAAPSTRAEAAATKYSAASRRRASVCAARSSR